MAALLSVSAFAVSALALIALWVLTLQEIRYEDALMAVAASFALSHVVSLLSVLGHGWRECAAIVLPLLSVGAWFVVSGGARAHGIGAGSSGAAHGPGVADEFRSDTSPAFSRQFVYVLILFVMVGGVVRGLSTSIDMDSASGADMSGMLFRNVLSLSIASLFAFWTVSSRWTERRNVLAILFAVALFLVGLFAVSLYDAVWTTPGLGIVNVARNCLEYLLLVAVFSLMSGRSSSKRESLRLFAGLYLLPVCAAQYVGYIIVPSLLAAFGLAADEYAHLFAFGMALVLTFGLLAFACIILLGQRKHVTEGQAEASSSSDELGGGLARGTSAALEKLVDDSGLTEREAEVVVLLSQGYSYKKVAERLYISMSTVQSHTRNIYRKCGVNSRQELIDLVEAMDCPGHCADQTASSR